MEENIIDCECNDFKLSWPQIIGAQCFVATHGGNYTGEKIRFCPWCGKCFLTQRSNGRAESCEHSWVIGNPGHASYCRKCGITKLPAA